MTKRLIGAVVCVVASAAGGLYAGRGPEPVTIESSGTMLAGEYRHAGPGSAAVLFYPMCARQHDMQGWAPVAERLATDGVSSLILEMPAAREHWKAHIDAAISYIRSRTGGATPLAVAGSSCGVAAALSAALNHPGAVRAVVALTGPHGRDHVTFVRNNPSIAVFAAAAAEDGPALGWARELRVASSNPESRLAAYSGRGHGTDVFGYEPRALQQISEWLEARLRPN